MLSVHLGLSSSDSRAYSLPEVSVVFWYASLVLIIVDGLRGESRKTWVKEKRLNPSGCSNKFGRMEEKLQP